MKAGRSSPCEWGCSPLASKAAFPPTVPPCLRQRRGRCGIGGLLPCSGPKLRSSWSCDYRQFHYARNSDATHLSLVSEARHHFIPCLAPLLHRKLPKIIADRPRLTLTLNAAPRMPPEEIIGSQLTALPAPADEYAPIFLSIL